MIKITQDSAAVVQLFTQKLIVVSTMYPYWVVTRIAREKTVQKIKFYALFDKRGV